MSLSFQIFITKFLASLELDTRRTTLFNGISSFHLSKIVKQQIYCEDKLNGN